jgi:hypothetical protein
MTLMCWVRWTTTHDTVGDSWSSKRNASKSTIPSLTFLPCNVCVRLDAGLGKVRDSFGKVDYLSECEALGVRPVAQIVKYLEHEELHLAHYGIGSKGLVALLAALKVRL